MQPGSDEIAHLERLQVELIRHGLDAHFVTRHNRSHLRVANRAIPELNERVLCWPAEDQGFCFWWPWKQPIGSVDDLDTVISKITAVLRSVEGQS